MLKNIYSFLLVIKSVNTGTNNKLDTADTHKPEIITTPSGCHKLPPKKVNGSKPPMVVNVVNNIGVKRVELALIIASCLLSPSRKF